MKKNDLKFDIYFFQQNNVTDQLFSKFFVKVFCLNDYPYPNECLEYISFIYYSIKLKLSVTYS